MEWRALVHKRLAAALNFLEETDTWSEDSVLQDNSFVMTNTDEDGNIVAIHNQLALKGEMSLDRALALFRVYPIGYEENANTHLYRFYPEEEQTLGTVEWFAMDNCAYNVFVPSYPMLLTDTWEGYKVQHEEAVVSDQKLDGGDWYESDGEYHIHPKGWDTSYIGTRSALTNLLVHGNLSEREIALEQNNLLALQERFKDRFAQLSQEIRSEPSLEARRQMMTEADKEMASEVHDLALGLYRYLVYGEESDLVEGVDRGPTPVPLVAGISLVVVAALIIAYLYRVRRRRA